MKSVMYTEYSDLNKKCFMNILAEVITDWATPENLVKAGKRVGITSTGLSVEWMDQAMFERAAAVLNPESPTTTPTELPGVTSPEGVRKNSAGYLEIQVQSSQRTIFGKTTIGIPTRAGRWTPSIQEG